MDPDPHSECEPDPATQFNADPCGSGSATLIKTIAQNAESRSSQKMSDMPR